MSRLYFNKQNKIECPTLVLQNKSKHNYGAIADFYALTYKPSFNAPNEISFTVYKRKHSTEYQNEIWDNLTDLKVVYIPELKEKFEVKVDKTISDTKTKSVVGTALAEAELSQILLRNIEINTETDIVNELYDTNFRTIFYRDIDDINNEKYIEIWESDKKYSVYKDDGSIDKEKTIELRRKILYNSSLLHRLLDKAVNYSIAHVDDSLKNLDLIKLFSINNQNIYNELVGEISREYGVLFIFDSMNRTVSAYDLYNTCHDCGYRDDFDNECPKCGSKNIGGQYGVSTPVLVSAENLATELNKTGDPDSVKTYFKVEGGDDVMNAAISAINPTGNQYIFYLPDYMLEELPQKMRDRLDEYNALKNRFLNDVNYLTEEGFSLSTENVNNYNSIVRWLYDYDKEDKFPLIGTNTTGETEFEYNSMDGYDSVTRLYYDLIDLEYLLKTSLMPTQKMDKQTLTEAFDLITEAFHPINESEKVTVAVSSLRSVGKSSVDNAVVGVVNVVIDTSLFDSEIISSTYTYNKNTNTAIWEGMIRLINKETIENEKPETMERQFTLDITEDVLEYTRQKIKKNMTRVDLNEIVDLTSLDEKTYSGEPVMMHEQLWDSWLEWFKIELKYYSVDNLSNLITEFEACRSVICDLQDELNDAYKDSYEIAPSTHFYNVYTERIDLARQALAEKEEFLNQLYKLYQYDSQTNYSIGEVAVIRRKVQELLDFQKYLENGEENYWSIFCSYLREDTYTNENYISTDLSSADLIDRAKELLEVAYKEIQKSAYNQYTITSTMNNLFAIKDFQPFRDYFDIGNWIRVDVDDEIHKLRLLSYQINFDELQNIDVEFSSVIHSPSFVSDLRSVFNSVSNISNSYDAVTKQVNVTSELLDKISGKIDNGIDSSTTKIVNDKLIEEIIIDKNGIMGRAYDDITGEYDNCQYKFIRNGLYMTNDSWKSIYNAIGRFRYDTGETEVVGGQVKKIYKTAYGIKADTIVGNFILSKKVTINNEDNSIILDEDGFRIVKGNQIITEFKNDGTFSLGKESLIFDGENLSLASDVTISWDQIEGVDDAGFVTEQRATQISRYEISTSKISADQIKSGKITSKNGLTEFDLDNGEITSHGLTDGDDESFISIKNNKIKFLATGDRSIVIYPGFLGLESAPGSEFYLLKMSENVIGSDGGEIIIDAILRANSGITVNGKSVSLEGHTHGAIYHNGNKAVDTGNDGKNFVRSTYVYNRSYASGGSSVIVTEYGTLGRISSSSIRYKHDVEYFSNRDKKVIDDKYIVTNDTRKVNENDLLSILDIPVVSFKYNEGYVTGESDFDYEKPIVGFISDDIASICPDCATYISDNNGEKIPESWDERQMIPRMLYVIQKQNNRIKELENKLEELSSKVNTLIG